jgi:hypothetical protein
MGFNSAVQVRGVTAMARQPNQDTLSQARQFALQKYDRDRAHELELNKATLLYEHESLKILSYLNGGAAFVYVGFLGTTFKQDVKLTFCAHALPVGLWALGLLATAMALWLMYESQVKFTQAYHARRRAEEKRQFGDIEIYKDVSNPCISAAGYDSEGAANARLGTRFKRFAKFFSLIAVVLFSLGLLAALKAVTSL